MSANGSLRTSPIGDNHRRLTQFESGGARYAAADFSPSRKEDQLNRVASISPISIPVGIIWLSRKPAEANNALYSLSVRSRPPFRTSYGQGESTTIAR